MSLSFTHKSIFFCILLHHSNMCHRNVCKSFGVFLLILKNSMVQMQHKVISHLTTEENSICLNYFTINYTAINMSINIVILISLNIIDISKKQNIGFGISCQRKYVFLNFIDFDDLISKSTVTIYIFTSKDFCLLVNFCFFSENLKMKFYCNEISLHTAYS